MSEGFVIVGEDKVLLASRLALRSALKLETKGLKMSRGRSAQTIVNELMGTKIRNKVKCYEAFDKWLVETYADYGVQSRPL